jgi:hypothetical protein
MVTDFPVAPEVDVDLETTPTDRRTCLPLVACLEPKGVTLFLQLPPVTSDGLEERFVGLEQRLLRRAVAVPGGDLCG